MRGIVFTFMLIVVLASTKIDACTTAVISGKYTESGRPMIWKNRDTWALNNSIAYFKGEKFDYMGLVNSKDIAKKSIWIGMNSTGFAIMNSASYNLNNRSKEKLTGLEGRLMKEALATCKTLDDFEKLLNKQIKPTGLEANFGVIDAQGGAAYYELGHKGFVKIDANDPKVAPFGYIIRANYSNTGEIGVGSGYIRYNTVNDLFYQKASTTGITPQYIEQRVAKSLYHSLVKEDLEIQYGNFPEGTPKYAHFRDYIPRSGSSSSVTIEGVRKGETPDLTTMWAHVGFPLSSTIVPLFMGANEQIPSIVQYNAQIKDSPICNAALQLKKEKVMNIRWGKTDKYYINVNSLYNSDKTGIVQLIENQEDYIFERANSLLKEWRKKGKIDNRNALDFYQWIENYITDSYLTNFKIEL